MNNILLSVAGSDSCSGAGIQRDTLVGGDLGIHTLNVITAVTAQNSNKVFCIEPVSDSMFKAQLDALKNDFRIRVVKSGMLATVGQIVEFSKFLNEKKDIVYICDPVMVSTSGYSLMTDAVISAVKNNLLSYVDVFTPNIFEAQKLLDMKLSEDISYDEMLFIINELINKYNFKSVILKGGHQSNPNYSNDAFYSKNCIVWLRSNRYLNGQDTHGSGCAFSAAIGSFLVKGYDLCNSVVLAKAYITSAIKFAKKISKNGSYFLTNTGFPANKETFVDTFLNKDLQDLDFKKTDDIGLYPVVDSSDWVHYLAKKGIKNIQLRIKSKSCNNLEEEISKSIQYQNKYHINLFINDHYHLAITYGAFGIHLGHEDIVSICMSEPHVLKQISDSNMALGLSTHDYYELTVAKALNPSYIALGPIFDTSTKEMKFAKQGVSKIIEWKKIINVPLVAIGGIKEFHIHEIMQAGADGVAFVTLLTLSNDPDATLNTLKSLIAKV